jgi:hypothetical protein
MHVVQCGLYQHRASRYLDIWVRGSGYRVVFSHFLVTRFHLVMPSKTLCVLLPCKATTQSVWKSIPKFYLGTRETRRKSNP